jgi:hypothetical protein
MRENVPVEVSEDILGWLLLYKGDGINCREGEPVGDPDYFPSKRAAQKAAREHNEALK